MDVLPVMTKGIDPVELATADTTGITHDTVPAATFPHHLAALISLVTLYRPIAIYILNTAMPPGIKIVKGCHDKCMCVFYLFIIQTSFFFSYAVYDKESVRVQFF